MGSHESRDGSPSKTVEESPSGTTWNWELRVVLSHSADTPLAARARSVPLFVDSNAACENCAMPR